MPVKGEGTVEWNMVDIYGNIRPIQVPALYVPSCDLRLLRPHSITEMYPDEELAIVQNGIKLSGSMKSSKRGPIMAHLSEIIH